jgi:DNA-binding transcriptional ArsR family regulator
MNLKKLLQNDRRRAILSELAAHPNITTYKVAKKVFGDGVKYYKACEFHLKKLRRAGIVGCKKERRKDCWFITDKGKILCFSAGLPLPSQKTEELISLIPLYATGLSDENLRELERLLLDPVVQVFEKVLQKFNVECLGERTSLQLDPWTFCIVMKLYEREKELRREYFNAVEKIRAEWFDFVKWLEGFKNGREVIKLLEDPNEAFIMLSMVEKEGLTKYFEELAQWFEKHKEKLYPHKILELEYFLMEELPINSIINAYYMYKHEVKGESRP